VLIISIEIAILILLSVRIHSWQHELNAATVKQSSQLVSLVKPPTCVSGRVHTHLNCLGSHHFCSSCYITIISSWKLTKPAVPLKCRVYPKSVRKIQTVTKSVTVDSGLKLSSYSAGDWEVSRSSESDPNFFFWVCILPLLVYKIVGENAHWFQYPQLRADYVITSLNWHLLKGRNHITKK